jgi:hypothetical protein
MKWTNAAMLTGCFIQIFGSFDLCLGMNSMSLNLRNTIGVRAGYSLINWISL